jgi:thiol-disulfide isomerase/thioredoxin
VTRVVAARSGSPLAARRGRPVLLYIWDPGCGDCRAQAPALARAAERWRPRGLEVVALTRHGDGPGRRAVERAAIDRVWAAGGAGGAVVVSAASMERYGGSSTPTFVFIDRAGRVREFAPWRFTDEALDRALAAICR